MDWISFGSGGGIVALLVAVGWLVSRAFRGTAAVASAVKPQNSVTVQTGGASASSGPPSRPAEQTWDDESAKVSIRRCDRRHDALDSWRSGVDRELGRAGSRRRTASGS